MLDLKILGHQWHITHTCISFAWGYTEAFDSLNHFHTRVVNPGLINAHCVWELLPLWHQYASWMNGL